MGLGKLSDLFNTVILKRVTAVEVEKLVSNQHEFQGIAALREVLGPSRLSLNATVIRIPNDMEPPEQEPVVLTWYDARENQPDRSPEYRLYYREGKLIGDLIAGDVIAYCFLNSGSLVLLCCASLTSSEQQLRWLFGELPEIGQASAMTVPARVLEADLNTSTLDLLTNLGFGLSGTESVEESGQLADMIARFGDQFPSTKEFSAYARNTIQVDIPPSPDLKLTLYMDWETQLFCEMEKHLVSDTLRRGFATDSDVDVAGFVEFALSVNNRRKSRAGLAFQHHFALLLEQHNILFTGKCVTENRKKPDFLFPNCATYHSSPTPACDMVGLKTSCKDRWRQVLSEAGKIPRKHLLTMEPGFSIDQLSEMRDSKLTLVLPAQLHNSCPEGGQDVLMSVAEFLAFLSEKYHQ